MSQYWSLISYIRSFPHIVPPYYWHWLKYHSYKFWLLFDSGPLFLFCIIYFLTCASKSQYADVNSLYRQMFVNRGYLTPQLQTQKQSLGPIHQKEICPTNPSWIAKSEVLWVASKRCHIKAQIDAGPTDKREQAVWCCTELLWYPLCDWLTSFRLL